MMEQMLKLCMFLKRDKLTLWMLLNTRHPDRVQAMLFLGSSPLHNLYSNGSEGVSCVHSELDRGLNTSIVYIQEH